MNSRNGSRDVCKCFEISKYARYTFRKRVDGLISRLANGSYMRLKGAEMIIIGIADAESGDQWSAFTVGPLYFRPPWHNVRKK